MVYKKHKMGPYTLHTIKTDKFKLCHMEIIFRNNVDKDTITKRNILFDYLTETNNELKTKRDMALKLEDLYNASIYSLTSKVGNATFSNVCLDVINPKYTKDEEALFEAIKLTFSLIFNPLATNKEFDNNLLDIVKQRTKASIKSIKESPKKYAIKEALKTLGDKTKSSFTNIGEIEDLENITPASLYKYYEKVLKHDFVDIYVIGDLDMDKIKEKIDEYAKFTIIKEHDFKMYVENLKRKALVKSENFIYAQTNIVMILNLNKLSSFEQKYVANLYNIILGGGSLETKLYKILRNENSLCYNVNSMYQKYDGLVLITTAVDVNAKDKAIKLIKASIKEMANNISDEELEHAKSIVKTSLNMQMDNIGRIVDNYFYRDISDLDDYETRIKEFNKVTKEDIYNMSKKVSIHTVYSLVGGENNEKESN